MITACFKPLPKSPKKGLNVIKLAVSGCQGRMGQRILDLALKEKAFQIACLLENKDRPDVNNKVMGFPVYVSMAFLKRKSTSE